MRQHKIFIRTLVTEAVILLAIASTHEMMDRATVIFFLLLPMVVGAFTFYPQRKVIPHASKNSIFEMSKNEFLSNMLAIFKRLGWTNINLTYNNDYCLCVDLFGLDENGRKTLVITRKTDFDGITHPEEAKDVVELALSYPKRERTIFITTSAIPNQYVHAFAKYGIECLDGEALLELFKEKRLEVLR